MPSPRKIIITGTGRAGTTFLVRLLTELGLNTGFDAKNWQESYDEHCCAGLEHDLGDPDAPTVIKNPELCRTLPALLREGKAPAIEHVLIPIRELESAARSRIRIGGGDGEIPGGLWLTSDPAQQAPALATVFHDLIYTLAEAEIPFSLLAFPRFARDERYAFERLRFLFPDVPSEEFSRAFARISDPALIHSFGGPRASETDHAIAAAYEKKLAARKKRERARRNKHRLYGFGGTMAAVALTLLALLAYIR